MGIDARILLRNISVINATDANILLWSRGLCRAIGGKRFSLDREHSTHAITRTGSRWREEGDPAPGQVWQQDGDDINAHPGECLLEVHVWTRFYGVSYERGDLLTLCNIAEWCEMKIPSCEVWYGGDSSGCCAEPWGIVERHKLKQHLFSNEGRDYFKSFYSRPPLQHEFAPERPVCSLCRIGMTRNGWGNQYARYFCNDCSYATITNDGGKTWTEPKHNE